MDELKEGVYDQLVTERVRRLIEELGQRGLRMEVEEIEEVDRPEYLARHLAREVRLLLRSLHKATARDGQVALANSLLRSAGVDVRQRVDPKAEVLRSVYRGPSAPVAPSIPLGMSDLLMNATDAPRLGFELGRELATADRVLMVVSFIQWRGWMRLRDAFLELASRGVPVRVLTTTYMGASEFRAIEELSKLPNVETRISLSGDRRRLHAKAWLFERDNGFSSVYVGSANLSGPALEDGIEWTVKLSQVEAPHVIERFKGAFESLWCDEEFGTFRPEDEEFGRRVRLALQQGRGGGRSGQPVFFDLRPHPYQQATLDRLAAEREDRELFRNLVVAPTGTGKTLVAAFDYERQPYQGRRPRLLFLAHREELLRQARDRFRHVLRDESFGDLLAGGEEPVGYDYLFSTIQSFRSRGLLHSHGPAYWDYAVLDEAHHVPAESFGAVVEALRPRVLLGLTATPERTDGVSILPWFGHRIADEMRLWHAIERQYLVPFDYYGIHDGTDLSKLTWARGTYSTQELERVYRGDTRRANLIISEFCQIYGEWGKARALAFCVSIAHAEYMGERFRAAGIPALAVTSRSTAEERREAIAKLRRREVNVLLTVDLLSEGVDIPDADCVIFLRPTESATVFLQQLGRGLRLSSGKTSCLVLDFIGNQRREFRFDQRFQALFGGTRKQVVHQLVTGITRLPGNCYFRLDKESRKAVLENVKRQLAVTGVRLATDVQALAQQLGRRPTLTEFLRESGYEIRDVYKRGRSWFELLSQAGLREQPEGTLAGRFERLQHIDSRRRLRFYLEGRPANGIEERRMAEMLTFRLLTEGRKLPECGPEGALERLQAEPEARAEFQEFCEALLEGVRFHSDERELPGGVPLYLHRSYMRNEILAGLGVGEWVGTRREQTGCLRLKDGKTEIFFVTLDKSDKAFSPTTSYEDFAVSPTRFHWQSQSTTAAGSVIGQRYVKQRENGARFLLFVRPKTDDPFVFLGPVRYSSHTGSRPMSIYWDLEHAMPAWFFEICASLRAA